jgi:hypothetical protein
VFLNSLISATSGTNNGTLKVSNSSQIEFGGTISEWATQEGLEIDPLDILALKFN